MPIETNVKSGIRARKAVASVVNFIILRFANSSHNIAFAQEVSRFACNFVKAAHDFHLIFQGFHGMSLVKVRNNRENNTPNGNVNEDEEFIC